MSTVVFVFVHGNRARQADFDQSCLVMQIEARRYLNAISHPCNWRVWFLPLRYRLPAAASAPGTRGFNCANLRKAQSRKQTNPAIAWRATEHSLAFATIASGSELRRAVTYAACRAIECRSDLLSVLLDGTKSVA